MVFFGSTGRRNLRVSYLSETAGVLQIFGELNGNSRHHRREWTAVLVRYESSADRHTSGQDMSDVGLESLLAGIKVQLVRRDLCRIEPS